MTVCVLLCGFEMYEDFYELSSKPFTLTPDEERFFMSPQHAQGLATLQYSILSKAGFTLVTAESGMGKTTIVNRVLSNLDDTVRIAHITNTHHELGRMVPWVLAAFEVAADYGDELACYAALKGFLDSQAQSGNQVVLIIDEAQNLALTALEELRLINNLNINESKGLQLVLVGKPGLDDLLTKEEQRDFAQRIAVDCRIEPFDYETTNEYISFQLNRCGGSTGTFDFLARAAIFYHSHGIPRLINNLCDLALVYGYGEEQDIIDMNVIKNVLLSKQVGLSAFNQMERSRSAVELHAMVANSHGIDIARFTMK